VREMKAGGLGATEIAKVLKIGLRTKGRRPMISVVDDDAFVRRATENLLLSLGHDVATFASAESFLESEEAETSVCLITDLMMPGLSGLDLQQRLIADGNRLPIVFITAFSSDNVRAQALAAGAIGFLAKPYEEKALIECLTKALNPVEPLSI
jgi:FixJ family two-component response regulator